ncbi:hypothetical protein GCM10008931_44160 [Oceanobacillus oncorhynchi subsp. oncorhynchi]|uniref:hypothetical protein n=1 Tax=Oceanobacillus oncorhynchi TaxID=545501 RepID=UPI0031DC99FA
MDYDIKLLMDSSIDSVVEVGDFLYRIDKSKGLSSEELESLVEILIKIDKEYEDGISDALFELGLIE